MRVELKRADEGHAVVTLQFVIPMGETDQYDEEHTVMDRILVEKDGIMEVLNDNDEIEPVVAFVEVAPRTGKVTDLNHPQRSVEGPAEFVSEGAPVQPAAAGDGLRDPKYDWVGG